MARGKTSLAALKKGSTWGTIVQCGALDGFRLNTSGLTGGKEVVPDDSMTGNGYGDTPIIGQEVHTGTVSTTFRYGGNCDYMLAAIMGTAGTPTNVETSLEYTHVLSFESRLGDFFTYCERKGAAVQVWEYASAMISRLVIEITGRGPGTIDMDLIAGAMIDDDSSTNSKSNFASVTIPTPIVPIFLGDCRVWINTQGGAALDSGDVIYPNLIRITVDRKLSEDWRANTSIGRQVSQPTETGDVEVFLQLGFPEYTANTYRGWVDDGTEQKATIFITSAAADLTGADSGDVWHEYDIDFPRLIGWERPDNSISGPERIEDGVTFRCIAPSAAPTGMNATGPFECTVRNQVSTNLLA